MPIHSTITAARFWSKVNVTKSDRDCWEWQGAKGRGGYGRIKINGKFYTASRVSWEMMHDRSMGDMFAMHTCDNPSCVNPHHIKAGTHQDNMKDMARKSRASAPCTRRVFDWDKVDEARRMIEEGETNSEIAKKFGVSRHTISAIRRGATWSPEKRT